jgi:hypothetical protein
MYVLEAVGDLISRSIRAKSNGQEPEANWSGEAHLVHERFIELDFSKQCSTHVVLSMYL